MKTVSAILRTIIMIIITIIIKLITVLRLPRTIKSKNGTIGQVQKARNEHDNTKTFKSQIPFLSYNSLTKHRLYQYITDGGVFVPPPPPPRPLSLPRKPSIWSIEPLSGSSTFVGFTITSTPPPEFGSYDTIKTNSTIKNLP